MKLPSLSFLLQAFVDASMRFPSTMLCACVGAGALMAAIEQDGNDDLIRLAMTAQMGLALCTGFALLAEALGWNRLRNGLAQGVGLALLALYYLTLDLDAPNMESVQVPRFFGFMLTAHLFVAAAPYLNRRAIPDFWEYNKRLFANFIVGGVFTVILYGGLALALLAVNELFDLHIHEKMYAHLFVLLAGIFQTAFFLYHVPRNFDFSEDERAYHLFFKNLCIYVLIPIVGLYFLILYAYSIKILVTWTLPKGWVSSLVLGFSVAGIFTYLINYLLPQYSDNKLALAYRRWFWWVLLPMVGLLFVAIGRRIGDYGVTPDRFFVAHAGVWLLAMCVYFLRSSVDNIKFIPISLALFVLVALLGPFSAFRVAERSQMAVLRDLLSSHGRFEGEVLKQEGQPVPTEEANRIVSAFTLLARQDALDRIAPWFPVPLDSIAPPAGKYGHYSRATALADWLKIGPEGTQYAAVQFVDVYLRDPGIPNGNIAGYRQFYRVDLFAAPGRKRLRGPLDITYSGAGIVVMDAAGKVAVDSFDLTGHMQAWKTGAANQGYYALPSGMEVLELSGTKSKARLYLQDARFEQDSLRLERLTGLLFVR